MYFGETIGECNKISFLCVFLFLILYAIIFEGNIYQEKICVLSNENTNAYLWWDSFHSIGNVDINKRIKYTATKGEDMDKDIVERFEKAETELKNCFD